MGEITIPKKASVRVYWDDKPENYSKQDKIKIRNQFADKYDIPKTSINVVFRPIKINDKGEKVEMDGIGIDNVMDVSYQHILFKKWLKLEGKDIDFDRLIGLDKIINEKIKLGDNINLHKVWKLKSLIINNFLSYGSDNYIDFGGIKGLTVITSTPENQGGKTSFSVDSLLFLLFGVTTKTDKNEEIFNQYSDKDELNVKGCIEIDDADYVIERYMKRSLKKDKTGYTIKNQVNYYELMVDGSERLLNDEDSKATTKKIIDTIGSQNDFMSTILSTDKNLEDLIDSQSTARGKLLSKFIGLEVIEEKEKVCRKLYNEFTKKMKSNHYNISDLEDEITEHRNNIKSLEEFIITSEDKLKTNESDLLKLTEDKESELSKKHQIDEDVFRLNPDNLNRDIKDITNRGKTEASNLEYYDKEIEKIGIVNFDSKLYEHKIDEQIKLTKDKNKLELEIDNIKNINNELLNSEKCYACGAKLKGVDNKPKISTNNIKITELTTKLNEVGGDLTNINNDIKELKTIKEKSDELDKLEIKRSRSQVEIQSLRNELKSKKNDLKAYKLNIDAIDINRNIDIKVINIKSMIELKNSEKTQLITKIEKAKNEIHTNNIDIQSKNKLIKSINKEVEVEKIYKLYLELVGKRGIGKLVLKSVLPIINFELHRLLDEICDFDLEIEINDKNDVRFVIIKDGIRKSLKSGSGFEKTVSALSLRAVLSRVSNLPRLNIIVFDEVLGKVAEVNLENMRLLFDKIKEMFDSVLLITHNKIVRDWADNIISIDKINNISKINVDLFSEKSK